MTVPPSGSRARRSSRRPGWLLLTVLLVLAIAASSALVFTDRVELLKFAVILALWAAVVAAFVSVIYRRQSDIDQAKARDLKQVYDLQLDREISARREYELSVESHLRRELAIELRTQATDEVAALRAELSALRTNLEILFDTDLAHRPALETERTTLHAYSDWGRDTGNASPDRVPSSRVDTVRHDDPNVRTAESPIIDVPEEPQPIEPDWVAPMFGGAHRRPSEAAPTPEEVQAWASQRVSEPVPAPIPEPPPPPAPPPRTAAEPAPERVGRHGPRPAWAPADTGAQWLPPPWDNGFNTAGYQPGLRPTEPAPPAPEVVGGEPRRGRHWSPPESDDDSAAAGQFQPPQLAPPQLAPPQPPPQPAPRHRGTEDAGADGTNTGGQSVAELVARLEAGSSGGGRRRRRDD